MSNRILAKALNISETSIGHRCRQIINAFELMGNLTNTELIEHIVNKKKTINPNKWFNYE